MNKTAYTYRVWVNLPTGTTGDRLGIGIGGNDTIYETDCMYVYTTRRSPNEAKGNAEHKYLLCFGLVVVATEAQYCWKS